MSGLHSPLAIVAMSCRLPGAADEGAYWSLLSEGRDAVSEMPSERLNRALFYDPKPGTLAKTYSTLAGLVPEREFSPEELSQWDPCHLTFLDVAKEAWGESCPVDKERVGVYVGHSGGSQAAGECVFAEQIQQALEAVGPEFIDLVPELQRGRIRRDSHGLKLEARIAARLVADKLNLGGPAMVVEAACASSLAALAAAALALDAGHIDCALVGGASYAKADSLVLFSHARSCSANGSRPFDESADGLIGSEGYVCLAVKTLARARQDGDRIRAVIRGIGLATDGRGRSLWAPRKEGQVLALKRAYRGLDPSRVRYLEAHATSTQVGDATEIEALEEFFGPHLKGRKLPIGSVKSNLGHTLEVAGLASMAKVILAMQHSVIPASINIERLNESIAWDQIPVEVVREQRSWDGRGLVGLSAFGIGGLNVHVVVEAYDPAASYESAAQPEDSAPDIVIVGRGLVAEGAPNMASLEPGPLPGGRIQNYRFDGLALRIPPRLIERGDPLGFMLLDAVGQALEKGSIAREKTAVVVATSFGNCFTDSLQMGLHLPEIEELLRKRLSPGELDEFRRKFLQQFPAVLDETGGFTASSLASRIAKVHNLMGGALALDSGKDSSGDALELAVRLLRRGDTRAVLCCTGERSLAYPSESAAALLLKTRSQALQDGDQILGVLPENPAEWSSTPGPFGAAQGIIDLLLSTVSRPVQHFRLGPPTLELLQERLEKRRDTGFCQGDQFRLAAVASNSASMGKKLKLAAANLGQRQLLEDQGVYFVRVGERRPRVAFCFAGQGSQYQGMLKTLVNGTPDYQQVEATLKKLGLPSFAQMAWSGDPALDLDPVTTQVSLLVADILMFLELVKRGLEPDCLVGHSFGEFAALVAGGVMTLEQALHLTRLRAQALANTPAGGLISVQASREQLEKLIQGQELWVTHCNAPQQTVLGGSQASLRTLIPVLEEHRLAFRELKVPGALHTPLVKEARIALRQALEQVQLRPPSRLFMSNVTNRYVTDPEEIKQNLVEQLVKPVRYVELIKRLVEDGVEILVEVGPGRTLTALHRQILGSAPVTLCSADHARRGPQEQLERLCLLFEATGRIVAKPLAQATSGKAEASQGSPIENFDATAARKANRRAPAPDLQQKGVAAAPARPHTERFLLDFVVDLTGYALDVIDLDWDLEADLGLDSIKQTQLFGELADLVGSGDARDLVKANFRTLRQIIDWLEKATPSEQPTSNASERRMPSAPSEEFQAGFELGREHRQAIRLRLRERARDILALGVESAAREQNDRILGIAKGAGVHPRNLLALSGERFPWEQDVTSRFVLRTVKAPLKEGESVRRKLCGAALVIGHGPKADALCAALDVPVFRANSRHELASIEEPLPHLFLVTSLEPDASTELEKWPQRRERFMEVYWTCQEWFRRLRSDRLEPKASIVAMTNLGGDFGLGGRIAAAESGAVCGLLKALLIEFWVAGHRQPTIRVIDSPAETDSQELVKRVLAEISVPRLEVETGWIDGERHLLKAFKEQVIKGDRAPKGTWIFTGGGRGITAHVVLELAGRYPIKVHILGRAPHPKVNPEWRNYWPEARSELKVLVMEQARAEGREPVKAWREAEKALEIESNLQLVPGATYHSVDISDRHALAEVLRKIREQDGPIAGVLQGAGASRDARFDQKSEHWVEQCVRAKIDGTIALMELTWDDPIEHFVAFGSISGRFGANGHTDYSMSNDMMAKLVDWYRARKPEVAATTFHWHAWGDVGMATKPETELGLQMIAMQFMPAQEGVDHLCRELEAGCPEPEVLITDDRYHRLFTLSEPVPDELPPLLRNARVEGEAWKVELDPTSEPFLKDHQLHDRPVLPLAIGLELMAEVALAGGQLSLPLGFENVKALEALTFFEDTPRTLTIALEGDGVLRVRTDGGARNGHRKQVGRAICEGISLSGVVAPRAPRPVPESGWQAVDYELGLGFHHGPTLRALKSWQICDGVLFGKITAPSPSEIFAADSAAKGWLVPSAVLDACLYAVGVLVAVKFGCGSAPRSMASLVVSRAPQVGEECTLMVEPQGEFYPFTLFGHGGDILIQATGYEVSLLGAGKSTVRR